jgi:thiamine biosynthesis protein ThiI
MAAKAEKIYLDKIKDKTFCVRVKRSGKHDFTSIELERYI